MKPNKNDFFFEFDSKGSASGTGSGLGSGTGSGGTGSHDTDPKKEMIQSNDSIREPITTLPITTENGFVNTGFEEDIDANDNQTKINIDNDNENNGGETNTTTDSEIACDIHRSNSVKSSEGKKFDLIADLDTNGSRDSIMDSQEMIY